MILICPPKFSEGTRDPEAQKILRNMTSILKRKIGPVLWTLTNKTDTMKREKKRN